MDSDAEFETEQNAEQEQHICSQKDHMAIAKENREMKSIIQRLQTQLRQEAYTSYRLKQLRDQYRFTIKELIKKLINQMTRLQPKEEEEMYDSDDENKESIKKKVEFLLRHTKKGLRDLSRQRFTPVSPAFDTKPDLNDLTDQGFTAVSQGSNKYYPDVFEFHENASKWEA